MDEILLFVQGAQAGDRTVVAAATDLLVHHLKRERIPAVVRRPAEGLRGRSLLELLEHSDSAAILEACRRMFAFGDAHA